MAVRRVVPLVIAGVFGIGLVVVIKSVSGSGTGSGPAPAKPPVGKDCTVVHLTASSEKAALLSQLAADYAKGGRQVDGRCAAVEVVSKASGGAADALARGWDPTADGPRPDVWSPAATSWTSLLQQKTTAADKPDLIGSAKPPSIATTPLVIAMPKPMAVALGWPGKSLGWGDVLKLARDPRGWGSLGQPYGAFTLGKTNPNFSTSGLHATIGAYVAATGTSSDLTAKDLADPKVGAYAKAVESSVVHYGDTTLTFLSNLQKADDQGRGLGYISAVAVEEKSVWDYNQGNPSGDPATLGTHRKPRIPLVAIYPKEGTLASDSPYAVLAAPWVGGAQRAVAKDFLSYLRGAGPQQRFADAAFRGYDGKPGAKITQANGLLPTEPTTLLSPPAPPVLAQVQALWAQQRKAARVLLVIDTSGSMGQSAGSDTKLELAKRAALKALDQFSPRDDVALWSFSTPQQGAPTPYQQLVPFSPISTGKAALRRQISALVPQGGTALYATTRAAFRLLSANADPSRINAVVLLTDGRNEYPQDTDLPSLERELSPEDTSRAVRVFPIGYGADADLPTLRGIADASRAAAYDASDPASIDKVFTAVLSNF